MWVLLCRGDLCGLPSASKPTLCVAGFCVFDSFPEVRPLRHGVLCTWFQFPGPASASRGLCAFVSSNCLHSLSWGLFVLLLAVQGGLCVLPKFVCLPSIGTPVPPFALAMLVCPLCCKGCAARVVRAGWACLPHHTRLPGPALCAARIVCSGWVCMPQHSWFPEPEPKSTVCLGPQSMSC